MFTQKSIKIFHSVQEIRPFSLFQNLVLDKASTDDKCHFAIVSLFSEFEPWQKLDQSQVSFDNLVGYILSISMCMQNFITIFQSVQRGARWLSGRVSDSGARGPGFETYRRRVVSLSKTLYSPKVLVNYPGSDGSVPT